MQRRALARFGRVATGAPAFRHAARAAAAGRPSQLGSRALSSTAATEADVAPAPSGRRFRGYVESVEPGGKIYVRGEPASSGWRHVCLVIMLAKVIQTAPTPLPAPPAHRVHHGTSALPRTFCLPFPYFFPCTLFPCLQPVPRRHWCRSVGCAHPPLAGVRQRRTRPRHRTPGRRHRRRSAPRWRPRGH